jgi:hypothetical protein
MRGSVTLLPSVVPALDAASPNQRLRFMLAVSDVGRDATPDARVPPMPITFYRKYVRGMHILYRIPDMNSVPVEVQIAWFVDT